LKKKRGFLTSQGRKTGYAKGEKGVQGDKGKKNRVGTKGGLQGKVQEERRSEEQSTRKKIFESYCTVALRRRGHLQLRWGKQIRGRSGKNRKKERGEIKELSGVQEIAGNELGRIKATVTGE